MQKWILAGFCAVLVIFVVNGLLAYRNLRTLLENERLVTHTREVQREIEALLTDLRDMGTGQGGYLLTGNEAYLASYKAGQEGVPKRVEHLRNLMIDNVNQRQRLDQLDPLVSARITTLGTLIDTRREQGFEAARRELFRPEVLGQMGEIRQLIGAMAQEEDRLLAQRTKQSQASFQRLVLVFSVATLLGVAAVGTIFGLYRRDLAERARAEEALRRGRDELEERVGERTAGLEAAKKELEAVS